MIVRPVRDSEEDAEVVRAIAAAAFGASDVLEGEDAADEWTPERIARHHSRTRHIARSDRGGCWIVEDEAAGPLGTVLSTRREGLWGLSLFAVVPQAQHKGIGTALLARALDHGRGCLRGIICGSRHPMAARAYRRAGFTLHPTMRMSGTIDPAGLDAPDGAVHGGTPRHRDLMDSVDRRIRGGAHGPDHEELMRHFRLFVVDDLAGSGYCYLGGGKVELLAATSRRLATRLLATALLTVPEGERAQVQDVTAEQEWAVDVGLAAGLELVNAGYVCLRGMRPPSPYIPSGAFL
ncbi:GNAT family N-acetyltransferase [Streptomyces sp. RB6PN25]|uniref:GNAT family N-acetyltransferase n=1 Tax=Streptomyces humicola TaxID=2953240 RepID=A0ABT1PVA5_9ACTN|nr:GNAT family N-acetyltransferase [Streptomyces humicola]MCQ4081601.1 GNAT family N-acetyltransferase [Streptomyces humicola]